MRLPELRLVKHKLFLIVLLANLIICICAGGLLFAYSEYEYRQRLARELAISANIFAESVGAAMEFDDVKVAAENLQQMQADPNVMVAAIYNEKAQLFASYLRAAQYATWIPELSTQQGIIFDDQGLMIFKRIERQGKHIGTLFIKQKSDYLNWVVTFIFMLGLIFLVSLSLSLIISARILKWITHPIEAISQIATKVMERRDYHLRAIKLSEDETGRLADAFNGMLATLEHEIAERTQAESSVRELNSDLEKRVLQRTLELQLLNQTLQQRTDDAERANRAKAAFLANMSHEIRTPMNAIIGFADIVLQDPQLSFSSTRHLKIVVNSAKSLLGIINNILDLSKLESGKFALESVCFHLPNLLADALKLMDHQASERGLSMNVEYSADLPLRLMGDPTRLRQVLLNLVGNSIKFTEKGEIRVIVEPWNRSDYVLFSVIDTGIGMSQQQITKVFESFSQADNSTTRRFGGTGLGTTICKQIVELMGGEIWIDSQLGVGTAFHFTANLPLASHFVECLYERESPGMSAYVSPRTFKILLAEDIEANATLASLRLKQQGHEVLWVRSGLQALAAYLDDDFDLILMDVMMPEMDGLTATEEIRKAELASGRHITIFALTASVMREDNEKCLAAGMDSVQAKPVNFDDLLNAMEQQIPAGVGQTKKLQKIVVGQRKQIDFTVLREHVDYQRGLVTWLDEQVYALSLHQFASEHIHDGEQMQSLFEQGGAAIEQARMIAHNLKGVAGNLYLSHVAELAIAIDADLKSKRLIQITHLFERLDFELKNFARAMRQFTHASPRAASELLQFNRQQVADLFEQLYIELESLSPDTVEPLLDKLCTLLPEAELAPIRDAVEHFNFDDAKNCLGKLKQKLFPDEE